MKPLYKALLAVGALAVLVAALLLLQNRPEPEQPDGDPVNDRPAVVTEESPVTVMTVENRHGTLRFIQDADENWRVEGREYAELAYAATAMALTMDGMAVRETLEMPPDLSEFGLAPPAAVMKAEHENGVVDTVLVGARGVTGNVYYCMVEGRAEVYLVNGVTAERLLFSFEEFRETALPKVNTESLTLLYMKGDREEIELASSDPDSEKAQFGMVYLRMVKPFEGRDVMGSTLQDLVYAHMGGIGQIGEFVEDNAKDFTPYGLDEPRFVFRAEDDAGGKLHLIFGADAPDGGIYFRLSGEPHVCAMPKEGVEPLMAISAFYLTDRFIAIYSITDVSSIVINDKGFEWALTMDEDETFTLNGEIAKDSEFRWLYQKIVGIMGDAPIDEEIDLPGEPEVVITYYFHDGRPPAVVELYNHDGRLYAASLDGELKAFSSIRYTDDLRAVLKEMSGG